MHFVSLEGKMTESAMGVNRLSLIVSKTPLKMDTDRCLQINVFHPSELWYHRYGHLSYKGLRTLSEKNMVVGLPYIAPSITTCKTCLKRMQRQLPFSKHNNSRASDKLQLIHSDFCGPMIPTSNGQNRCLLTFIDDFS